MSKSGAKLYCRLLDYIEDKYPKLFDVVKVLCLEYLFTVRGKAGVTFLCPQDHDELVKLANSGSADSMLKASEMLSSLVMPIAVRNVDEFKSMAAKGLPNNLGLKVPIDEKKSTSSKAVMTNGAEIEPEKEFHTFKKDPLLFIYALKGAIPPIDPSAKADMGLVHQRKQEFKAMKSQFKKEGKGMDYLGSFELSIDDTRNKRIAIISVLENEYKMEKKNNGFANFGPIDTAEQVSGNPLIEAGIELACYILRHDRPLFESTIYPLISFGPADIYILLCPFAKYNDHSKYYVSDDHLKKWCEWRKANKCSIEMRNELLEAIRTLMPGRELVKNIGAARVHVLSSQRKAEEIKNYYKILSGENRIGKVTNVFPSGLASKYVADGCRKMHEDELRFVLTLQFERLDLDFEDELFIDTIEFASDFQRACSEGRAEELSFIKEDVGEQSTGTKIGVFVNSSLFLYVPMFKDEIDVLSKESILYPKPGSYTPWNYHKMIKVKTNRILMSQNDQSKKVLESILANNKELCASLGDAVVEKIKAAIATK